MYVSLTSEPGKHDFNLICQDTTENVRRDKTASRSARMRSGGAYADELYCTVCTVVHRPSRATILQGKVGACHSRFSMAFGIEKKKKIHPRLGILNKHGQGRDRPHARRIHLASRELPWYHKVWLTTTLRARSAISYIHTYIHIYIQKIPDHIGPNRDATSHQTPLDPADPAGGYRM